MADRTSISKGDATKAYTEHLESNPEIASTVEKPTVAKHNMSTAVDKDAIRRAYDDVRSDTSDTEW